MKINIYDKVNIIGYEEIYIVVGKRNKSNDILYFLEDNNGFLLEEEYNSKQLRKL